MTNEIEREQVALMPVERSYDVRAKQIIAFNECRNAGGDLDDALDAAYKVALRYTPAPSEQPAPVAVVTPPEQCRQRIASEGKPYPRSSCAVCGQFSPKSRECDALIEAARLNPIKQ